MIHASLRAVALMLPIAMSAPSLPLIAQTPRRSASERIDIRVSEGSRLAFDLSPDGRTIAFDLLGQLWLVPAQGGEARPITDAVRDTAEDLDPAFSPDGRQLVFKGERSGSRGLWLLDLGAKAPRQITKLPNAYAYEGNAAWSPDGKAIAFARVHQAESPGSTRQSRIVLIDVATRAMRELRIEGLSRPNVRNPAWTHDGKRIAFVAGSATNSSGGRIWIVDAMGGTATPLTGETSQAFAPAVAPDSRSIAFFAPDSAHRVQLWTQGLSPGAAPARLTDNVDVAPTRVRYTADGKTLLYSADGHLWRVAVGGGRAAQIPFTARLAFNRPRQTLPAAHISTPGERYPARAFMGLALSPDAKHIAAIALRKLWIVPIGGPARPIAGVPQTARHMTWSADGSEVAWSAGDWNQEDLFATTIATGITRRLTSLPGREALPTYSPDGRHLAFVHATASGLARLRVIPARPQLIEDTTQTKSIGPVGLSWTGSSASPPIWTPTSDGLLITGSREPNAPTRGIILKLAGAPDSIARFPNAPMFLQWLPSGGLVYLRHDRLWQSSFTESRTLGEPRTLGNAPAIYASASRDGTILFMSEGGLRLRSPDGKERRLGWPISYSSPVPPSLLIRNVRVIDGVGASATAPGDLLVERGRISRIGKAGSISSKNAKVIDAAGRFAIPGLMDLHAHNYRPDLLPGFLYFGVTTVRDQGANIAPLVAYGDAINAGVHPGARVTLGGFQFYSDGPFDDEQGRGIEPEADPDHVRRSVALAEAFGAQHIKTRTFRRWDINARMIAEAHRRGMRVTGHCAGPLPLIAAGINTEEHISMCPTRVAGYYPWDIHMYGDLVQLFRAAGVSVVPTISNLALASRIGARQDMLTSDAELAPFLPPQDNFDWMLKLSEEDRTKMAVVAQASREGALKLAHAGVTIGTGTDVWQVPTAVHMEIEELVAAGLSPAAAIKAATADAARILGAEKTLGTIEPGKLADFILLDANPLDDVRNTRRIWAVVQNGHVVDRATLRADARAEVARRR